MVVEEVIAAFDNPVIDNDVFLGRKFLGQFVHGTNRDHFIIGAMHDQAGSRAGGQEREIIGAGRWSNRDKTGNFRATHHQLHRNPGTERETGCPAHLGIGVLGLHPVQGGCGIAQFTLTIVKFAL